jgi:flagellar basal-body rod protein FlgF
MDKSLYIAMTGASQNTQATAIHANNLANVSTTGFRADFAQARAMPVFGESHPSRVYAMTERPGTSFQPGSLIETGRKLDVAITNDGWVAVQAPDGSEAYTRSGNLSVDVNGVLQAGSGLPVIGNGGPIAIAPFDSIEIGTDGSISIRPLGTGPESVAVVDRIKLVNPDKANLRKDPDGLMRTRDGAVAEADASVNVTAGFLESSNVNAIQDLTEIISLSRQFELQIKLMSNVKENSEVSARLLQVG